jgi:arylsulfatase A-like enzyme
VDTLRADHVHSYGYARVTTPNIDALAASGVRFVRAWAHSPWTLPSHATMLSGTQPFRHGVVDDGTTIGPSVPLIAPILAGRGYATAGVVSAFYVSSRFGFDRGFDRFEDFGLARELRPRDSVRAEEVTDQAVRDIAAAGERPFFLFAHYFDAHNDYAPPDPWSRAFDEDASTVPYVNYDHYRAHPLSPREVAHVVAQYDEEILYADEMIGRLLKALRKGGRADDTYIVLTSDHGEEFFEHASWGHGNSLYSEVLRVPLIIAGPGVAKGRVRDELVRHVDLAPTLLDLLSVHAAPGQEGTSYAPLLREPGTASSGARNEGAGPGAGKTLPHDRFLLTETSRFGNNLVGCLSGDRALIVDLVANRAELYDLARDPREKSDLSTSRPPEVARLLGDLMLTVQSSVLDRWLVSWDAGSAGCARVEGMIVGGERPSSGARRAPTFESLKTSAFAGTHREQRVAVVPPDASIEFFVTSAGVGCGAWTTNGTHAPGSERRGSFYRLDPLGDRARLTGTTPLSLTGPSGSSLRVRIESTRRAGPPSNLTQEEKERLDSLGYGH